MVFVTRPSPGFVAKIEETENQFRAEAFRNSLDTFDYYPHRSYSDYSPLYQTHIAPISNNKINDQVAT